MVLCEHLHLNVQELAPVEILECNIKLSGVNLRKCWPGVTLGLVEVTALYKIVVTPTIFCTSAGIKCVFRLACRPFSVNSCGILAFKIIIYDRFVIGPC